jgi:aminobenzoyl-glutamate transport protein
VSAVNPATEEVIAVQNPFSSDGITWLFKNLVSNFTGFAPLGLVITMTLAIGLCEEGGLIMTLLNDKLRNVPPVILPFVVAFVGTVGNLASDTAMVVIPPIAAILYYGAGKHPVVGMINGYAGAQAGFSANIMVAGTDALLQGITNTNLDGFLGEGKYAVDVTCNWYFMLASTFLCAIVIGLVCNLVVDKRFGTYTPTEGLEVPQLTDVDPRDKKALGKAGIVALLYIVVIAIGYFFGPLANINEDGSRQLVGSLFLSGLIPILFFFFAIPGVVFGFASGRFKNSTDVNKAMVHQMSNMGSYIAFCFFCGQFNGLFNWSKLGTVIAIGGADLLERLGFTGFGMIVCVILMTGVINLFVPSGSSKWAILAPVFIPMLMLLGYHPGFIQLIYRLGDSPTNAFTPLSPYIWVTLSVAQTKYDKNLKIGTLAAGLFPIAIVLQIAWIIFLAIWMLIDLPIGPGVTVALPAGIL